MIRFRNFLPLVAILVGVAILGAPTRAHADFQIDVTDSSGTTTVFFAPGTGPAAQAGLFTGLSGNGEFLITVLAGIVTESNAQTELDVTNLRVERLVAGTGTLTLTLGANNLTLPPGTGLNWVSGAGGTYSPQPTGGEVALTFQSYGDANNVLLGTSQTLGSQAAVPPSSTVPSTFDTGEATGLFTRGAGDFSLRSDITLTITNAAPAVPGVLDGSIVGFQGHNIVSAVPAPPSLLLAFSGLPLLGIGHWLRRRKSQTA